MISVAKNIFNRCSKIISLLIIFNCLLVFSQPVKAEKSSDRRSLDEDNQGLPIYRRDGGSRTGDLNRCIDSNRNLVALVPKDRVPATASISPNLFFYVPETTEPKTLEFVLRNETDELVYEAFLTTNGKGIVEVNIPAEIRTSEIETKQNYRWYLSLICNPQQRARDLVVQGWMRRGTIDSANIKHLLNNSDTVDKAEIYQQQGFWYDALSILAESRENSGTEPMIEAKWVDLLESVGLAEFASEPFIQSFPLATPISKRF